MHLPNFGTLSGRNPNNLWINLDWVHHTRHHMSNLDYYDIITHISWAGAEHSITMHGFTPDYPFHGNAAPLSAGFWES